MADPAANVVELARRVHREKDRDVRPLRDALVGRLGPAMVGLMDELARLAEEGRKTAGIIRAMGKELAALAGLLDRIAYQRRLKRIGDARARRIGDSRMAAWAPRSGHRRRDRIKGGGRPRRRT